MYSEGRKEIEEKWECRREVNETRRQNGMGKANYFHFLGIQMGSRE